VPAKSAAQALWLLTDSTIIDTLPAVTDAEKRVPLVFFRSDTGSEPVSDWLRELPRADRRVVGAGLKDLEFGWPIGMPLCRALGGGLFELRVSLRSRRIARVMVCVHESELVALHAFIKKTQKTPAGDMTLARSRKRQLERAK
jgi:phage-related protein